MIEATVIIAAWKAQDTLGASVASALAQQGVRLEVIVVDDASRDGTLALAERLAAADSRVRAIGLERNGGPAAARNAGLDAARGEWIAVLDSDDAMRPDRLARMLDFARQSGADIVCDALALVDEAGREGAAPPLAFAGVPEAAPWGLAEYIAGNRIEDGKLSLGFLKPLFRRGFLEEHGLRYDPSLRNGEDFHLVLAALTAGAVLRYMPEPGYLYTTRAGSVSNRLDPDHARALAQADAAWLERQGAGLAPELRALMRERMAQNADFATTETAMRALKARRPLAAARALAARPRSAGRLLKQLSEAARKRLGAKRKQ